ncbi:MAG: hypothetical protein ACI9KE_006541, partial [Polyangiales bacterium]
MYGPGVDEDGEDGKTTNPNKTVITVVGPPAKGERQAREACLVVIYGEDLGRRVPLGDEPVV